MPHINQIPDQITSANQYYQSKDSFHIEDLVNPGNELKSIIADQSNFRFAAYSIPPNLDLSGSTPVLEPIDLLSNNVLQVAISNMFPKLEVVNTPYGPISDINMETSDHDGFEFTIKYAVEAKFLADFRELIADYTIHRSDTNSPYKFNTIPNIGCRLEYLPLDPMAKVSKGSGASIVFHSCFILNFALNALSHEGNELVEIILTLNANRISQ